MNRASKRKGVTALAVLLALMASGTVRRAAGQDSQAPTYTMPEYNQFKLCTEERNAQQRIKCLDAFVTQYPSSTLLIFVNPVYYQSYAEVRNYAKVIEYVDKVLAYGDKIDAAGRYQALYARTFAYVNLGSTDRDQATKARDTARAGLKVLGELKKQDNVDDKTWDEQRKQVAIFFNGAAAVASVNLKDYPSAIISYKAVLALSPDDAITNYRLGVAYLESNPPQRLDGMWAMARAVTSKSATPEQIKQVKPYLRKVMHNYQLPECDNLVDPQLEELLALAATSPTRPESYKIPSAADLKAARDNNMTIASVLADLKAGGDKAKITWLVACGLEFPEVPGKVIEATPTDTGAILKVFLGATDEEIAAAKTANMVVKVEGQPEAKRVEKDNAVHFTGMLVSYEPDPLVVHWDKAKVNPQDIPEDKKPKKKPTRPVRKPPARRPR